MSEYNVNPDGITVWTPDKAPEWAKKHAPEDSRHIAWIPVTAGQVTALLGPGTAFGKGFSLQTVTLPGDVKGFLAYGTESE